MNKTFISLAIAASLLAATAQTAHASTPQSSPKPDKPYIGMGIGAATGAVLAGPVGFIAGGIIGGLVERHNDQVDNSAEATAPTEAEGYLDEPVNTVSKIEHSTIIKDQPEETGTISLAAASNSIPELYQDDATPISIIPDNLSLDVFFMSGQVSVDPYYNNKIKAASELLMSHPDLDIHLEGYSDRRGNKQDNIELSTQRLDSVRNLLIKSGIEPQRIHMHAYGEKNFISTVGDLEAYTFDRRVVIRFKQAENNNNSPVALHTSNPAQ